MTWFSPVAARDAAALARWRVAVGGPIFEAATSNVRTRADEITIVSWNAAVGSGDIVALARPLQASGRPLILLLQEVFRSGSVVPAQLDASARYASRLGGPRDPEWPRDIESVGRQLGLFVFYVPSMRNGDASSNEDRGNAILSTVPLSAPAAMELPLERQRRVAIAASVSGITTDDREWTLRLVNVHLDNMASARRAWIGGEYARSRQADALVPILEGAAPTVLGGDLNTWFGASDAAHRTLAPLFDKPSRWDERPTRGPFRLDHLFVRLADGWSASMQRGDDRLGSDHFPLVGTLAFR